MRENTKFMNINGMQVITSEHLTKTIAKRIWRNFKPGQRRGKNQSPRKLIHTFYRTVPDDKILMMNNMIVCHPVMYHQLLDQLEKIK